MNVSRNCANALATLLLLCCSSVALAAPAAAEPATPSMARLLFGLVAVLGLLALCAWLIRRGGFAAQAGAIKIIAQCPVGTRERVMVVQVGDQQLLLGVTPQQISLLHTLPQPLPPTGTPAGNRFAEQLAQLMKGQRPS